MYNRLPNLLTSLAIGITFAGAALVLIGSEAKAKVAMMPALKEAVTITPANPKVQALYEKASSPNSGKDIPGLTLDIRELISQNEIRNGADYAYAAAIMAKSDGLEDALLAHDLAVCALTLGSTEAKTLVAASQDRILAKLGRKQRFGTLAKGDKLAPVEADVPDSIRFIMGVPTLREAKKMAAAGKAFQSALAPIPEMTPSVAIAQVAVASPQ